VVREADEYLSIQDAARLLGVSRRHIWQLVKRGELPATVNPVDRRSKLIPIRALRALRRPEAPHPPNGSSVTRLRSVASYKGPVSVHSDEIQGYLEAHWASR
jgi:excisionase family DNA binding protein